jgi:hypothetical protein
MGGGVASNDVVLSRPNYINQEGGVRLLWPLLASAPTTVSFLFFFRRLTIRLLMRYSACIVFRSTGDGRKVSCALSTSFGSFHVLHSLHFVLFIFDNRAALRVRDLYALLIDF